MPDTGAPWNIPYVTSADLVSDWPADSLALANAVDAGLDAVLDASTTQLIRSVDFETVSDVSFTDGDITADYDYHRILFRLTGASGNTSVSLRLRSAGSDLTAAEYSYAYIGRDSNAATVGINGASQTSILLGYTAGTGFSELTMFDFLIGKNHRQSIHYVGGGVPSGFSGILGGAGAAAYTAGETFNNVKFISSGTFTGNMSLYGIKG